MIISITVKVPDEISARDLAAHIQESCEAASGQLEFSVIDIPAVDESILLIDGECSAELFRSE